jgi:hypothetical protein
MDCCYEIPAICAKFGLLEIMLEFNGGNMEKLSERDRWISVDGGGNEIGLGSGLRTLADAQKHEMPMEGFEPSTLAGPVFETGAYTVPPRRLVLLV